MDAEDKEAVDAADREDAHSPTDNKTPETGPQSRALETGPQSREAADVVDLVVDAAEDSRLEVFNSTEDTTDGAVTVIGAPIISGTTPRDQLHNQAQPLSQNQLLSQLLPLLLNQTTREETLEPADQQASQTIQPFSRETNV